MNLRRITSNGLLVLCLCFPLVSTAAPVTSSDGWGDTFVVDFSQFTGGNQFEDWTDPVQIGDQVLFDITASSATGDLWLYDESWGLVDNGQWTNGGRQGFIGVWDNDGPVRITFNDGPVSAVGFFTNYCPPEFTQASMSVFNAADQLLETFDIATDQPVSTPDGTNEGAFRGIQRGQAEIAYVELFGTCSVWDDMEFISEPPEFVPVPVNAPWALLLLGLGLLLTAMYGLRRHRLG